MLGNVVDDSWGTEVTVVVRCRWTYVCDIG